MTHKQRHNHPFNAGLESKESPYSKNHRWYYPSDEWSKENSHKLTQASIHHTMGPHFKDVYWIGHAKRPNVLKEPLA